MDATDFVMDQQTWVPLMQLDKYEWNTQGKTESSNVSCWWQVDVTKVQTKKSLQEHYVQAVCRYDTLVVVKSINVENLPNAKPLKFLLNETLVCYWFYSIKNNQNNIACPSRADNLGSKKLLS